MPTFRNYKIKVMVVGRKDIIESALFAKREEAESDLNTITEAREGRTEVKLPWLQMPGDQVQAAHIVEHSFGVY